MSKASGLFSKSAAIIEDFYWDSITYNGSTINAGLDPNAFVENQPGIQQHNMVFRLKKTDFPVTPPKTGDSAVIPVDTIGAGSYRIGERIAENSTDYVMIGTKIG